MSGNTWEELDTFPSQEEEWEELDVEWEELDVEGEELDVLPGQEEEREVLLGVGGLELVAEPEAPLVLQLQTAHRLAQGAAVSADHTQGRPWG